jgi:two-component system, NarL family, invasion response regulator UvrY
MDLSGVCQAVIRLLIADDHPIVREGLKRIVADAPDLEVVGEAVDGNDAIAKSTALEPDVVLLDVYMPGPGFLETLRRLRTDRPELRVLVLSVQAEDDYAIRALRAGAAGYLTKDHSPERLAEAIRQVHRGGRFLTTRLAQRMASVLDHERPLHEALSEREYQVFRMLGGGLSGKEIAAELELSPKTVSTYRTRVLRKLNLKSNADLIRYAVEHDLVDPNPA